MEILAITLKFLRMKQALQDKFYEQEVCEYLKKCAIDKLPSPDGYTMGFYLRSWDVLKQEIMEAFHNFHSQEIFEKNFNATYM